MKFKNLLIISLILLFILTINSVSATSNNNNTINSDLTDKQTLHTDNKQIDEQISSNVDESHHDTKNEDKSKINLNPQDELLKTEENQAENVYVNKSSKSIIETGTKTNPYKTLNEKVIKQLEDGTIINIANGKYELNPITFNKNLTIIGQNKDETILYTNSKNGLFNITTNTNLKIVNLTLRDYTSTISPAINNNGILTVENVFFQNANRNASTAKGGFIYNTNILIVQYSVFDSNIASYGACIYNNNAHAIIINSSFTNNEILNVGGAIYNLRSKMEVYNSTFTHNKAVSGAAIYNAFGNLTVNNTYFYKNDAQKFYGGAIYNTGRTIVNNSLFIENHATIDGGAITNTCYFYSINCTYLSNWASKNGGAIENIPVNKTETGNLLIINNTFSENSAVNKGGVIINYNKEGLTEPGTINIINTRFIENSADYGGVIYNERKINITNSTLKENRAETGSTLWTENGDGLIINNTKFIDNKDNIESIYTEKGVVDESEIKFLTEPLFKISDIADFIEGSPSTITVTETKQNNKFNGTVILSIGKEKYDITLSNGKATKTITPNLKPGTYIATLKFIETNHYTSADAKSNEFIITSKPTPKQTYTQTTSTIQNQIVSSNKKSKYHIKVYLTLKKVKKTSKNVKKLYLNIIVKQDNKKITSKNITLKIRNKKIKLNSVKNFKFKINIRNKTYTKKTDNKGKIMYKIINIHTKGTYSAKITHINAKNSAKITFKIKK